MSSQSQIPVSLPSIHELFPEHLMNPQHPSPPPKIHPSTTHRHHGHPSNAYAPTSQLAQPQVRAHGRSSRHPSGSSHIGPQRHIDDYPVHQSRATLLPTTHDAPHSPPRTFKSAYTSHSMSSMTVARDNHHSNRQGHSVASIPAIYHPARTPGSQDNTGHPGPHQALPSDRSHPWSTACSGPSSSAPVLDDPENYSDDDTPTAGAPSGVPRKHICPICRKAFNRPSSLKIHYNTHTGATPFRCPWPKCGREFNVNSNMRRHLRNHTANTNQETQEDGPRRRRRRSSASSTNSSVTTVQQSASEQRAQPQDNIPRHQAPPQQYGVPSHVQEASHHYMRYRVYDYTKDYHGMDLDEVDEYQAPEDPHRHIRIPVPIARGPGASTEHREVAPPTVRYHGASPPQDDSHFHRRSHSSSSASMLIRALTPGSSFHSSSPSPSPSPSLSPTSSSFNSPPPSTFTSPTQSPAMLPRTQTANQQQIQYSPSLPYLRGVRDSHVSTALRPAFSAGNNVAPRR